MPEASKWEREWWARRQDAIKSQQELRNKLIKQNEEESKEVEKYTFKDAKEFFERLSQPESFRLYREEDWDWMKTPVKSEGYYVTVPVRSSASSSRSWVEERSGYLRPRNSSPVSSTRICYVCGLRVDLYAACPGHPVGDANGLMPKVEEPVDRLEFDPETVVDGSVEVRELTTGET